MHKLISIVANNGNMLLNVAPKGDGTIDEKQRKIVEGIGTWLKVNGQAIFATRPWKKAREGTVRFTRSKDSQTLYAISLAWPDDGKLMLLSLAQSNETVADVSLLGHEGELRWRQTARGLMIEVPDRKPCEHAYSFRIRSRGDRDFAVS